MSLDLYQDETQQALDRLPSTPTGAIEAPFFQSFLPGGLKVMAGEMAKVGRAVSMAAGVVPVAADALANALPWLPGADMRESPTELQDRFFRQHDEVFGSAVKYWTPQPGEVGMAGEIVGSLAGMLPTIIANPALAVGSQVMSQAEDLVDKGVSTTKAVGVGVAQGAGLATGIWMPILGQNLWQRVVIGGAGFNAVQGVTTRAVSQDILGDDKAAELYPTLGLKELTLDLLLGMAFGGVAHISPQMRAQGKDAWARIATWAQDLTPAQVDAIAALRQAEHLNVETAPGTLKTPEDVEANVNRAKAALEQVLRDEPVQVEQMPAPRVEPDTARQVDAETRVAEMMADAERVRTEEGIPELLAAEPERPDMPALWGEIARLAPEEQPGAIGAAIERRLAELGVQANEAAANGAIWRSFFDTASKKYGVRAAELMQQYGIDVQRMQARSPGADAALAGAAESGYGGGRGRLEQPPGNRPQPQDLRATVAGGGPEQGWIGATRIRRSGGGEPLPAYRGSELALTPEHFEPGALGVASGNPSSGLGVWFTTTRSEAATYGKVQEAYLDVRNPKVVKVEDLPGFETTALATAYREQLRAQGFDGMVVTAKHLGGKTHIVAFDAKQVIPIGGHSEYGQAVKPGPMFYSELARQIQSAKMEQAPAKGWKDYIRGLAQKGVKADEVKWSGIEEWLDLQQGKVTRQQVSDFLEKNGVRVEDSPAFKRWSNDAPLVTSAEADTHQFKTGEKIVVEAFHGTKRPDRVGEKFLKKRATSGPMAFHTSSPELASRYAESKQDTSLAYEETGYENWFKYKPKGARSTVDIARAWYSLTPEQKLVIAERAPTLRESEDGKVVSLEGNTSGNGSYDHNLKETQRGFDRQGNPLKALVEDWLNSGVLFDREELFLDVLKQAGFPVKEVSFDSPHASHPFVYKNYIAMQKPLVTSDIPQDVRDALVRAAKYDRSRPAAGGGDMWDKNTRTLREWVAEFEKQDAPYVWTSIPDKVTVVLKSLGYDGIVDWSGKGGGDVHPVYIPFDETQVKSAIGNKGTFGDTNNILKQSSARGQINFDDGSTIISLFEGANASTFAHETGHLFLQITRDLAARTDAPSAAVADWATLEGWLGIKDGDIPVAAHEQFARGWEKYLAEGVAPTPELKGIFQQFRDWLLQVYRTLTELDVNLTDEIRGVMDRMLASEAADPTVKAQRATENLEADLGDSWYQRPTIGEDSVTMWHVTSKDLAESIVREGFKPGKVVGPWQGFAPMHKGTYGWSSKARAVFEVQRAAEVSGSVADLAILEIEVPKDAWGNLRPDEDVGRDATWQHSYMEGTVAFEGAVPPQYVKRIIEHGAAPTGGATTEAEGAPAPTGRAVPPPPRGEAGEARATPEAQDEPDPWLQVGRENAPAAEPAPARGLEDQEVRDILLVMAEHEAGWAEIGGRHLGGELGQPNFSAWVPRADWWPKREGKLNEAQTKEAVRKALAGEKLKKKEQLAIDYMVKIAGARANDVQAVGKDEWELTAAEVADAGLEPSTRNVVDAALLARANEISEGAVERLAVMFENDDAGFMAAVRRLIDENHQQGRRIRADLEAARRGQETGGQAPGPAGAEPQGPAVAGAGEPAAGSGAGQRPAAEPQGPAGANAAVDPLRQAVDDIVAADPNRMIVVGRNPDGTPIARTVGEYLDEARMQTELARQDAGLFEIAARCMLGGQ